MKRSLRVGRIVFHPSTLAVFSGVCGAIIGFLINLASGGRTAQVIWIADLIGATLTWAILDEADLRTAGVTEEQLRKLSSDRHLKRAPRAPGETPDGDG